MYTFKIKIEIFRGSHERLQIVKMPFNFYMH